MSSVIESLNTRTFQQPATNLQPVREKKDTLSESVKLAMEEFLSKLDGEPTSNIYDMVMAQVEKPLFEAIMHYTNGNQSRAAVLLGISRGTLRKNLKEYDLEHI